MIWAAGTETHDSGVYGWGTPVQETPQLRPTADSPSNSYPAFLPIGPQLVGSSIHLNGRFQTALHPES